MLPLSLCDGTCCVTAYKHRIHSVHCIEVVCSLCGLSCTSSAAVVQSQN